MPDFKGPGQWRSQAVKAQGLEDDEKSKKGATKGEVTKTTEPEKPAKKAEKK